MDEESGILQSTIGEIGDFFRWLKEKMQDDKVRRDTLLDLGLDPDQEVELEIPEESVNNIDEYRKSVDPDEVAFQSAVNDVKIVYSSLKEFIVALIDDPTEVDTYLWLFLEVNTTNYIRLHYPGFYWVSQLLGFLIESKVTFKTALEGQGLAETVVLDGPKIVAHNIWGLITDPIDYIKNLWHKIIEPREGSGHLETIESAEHLSELMTVLAGIFTAFGSQLPDNRYLFGWSNVPRSMEAGGLEDLKDSVLGNLLLKTIKAEHDPAFPDDEDSAWTRIKDVIEKKTANQELNDLDKNIFAEYLTFVRRWERGEWSDLVSERAFSFDLKFPIDKDSTLEKRLGATLFFVADEEVSEYFNKDSDVHIESLGGLFISLNGEVNYTYEINENWELKIKTSSGDVLDMYLTRFPDARVLGDLNLEMILKRKSDPDTGVSYNLPDESGTRLAVGEIQIKGFLNKENGGGEIGLKDNAVVISSGDGDSFLRELLPSGEVPLKFSVATGYTRKKGFYIDHNIDTLKDVLGHLKDDDDKNGLALLTADSPVAAMDFFKNEKKLNEKHLYELLIPIHKDLDLLYFDQVKWDYGAITKEDALGGYLKVLTTFSSNLGPVLVKVKNTGLGVEVSSPKREGDLGSIDFSFGFTPPEGVAIVIDNEIISGGGFLELDPDNHRYAGGLTLQLDLEKRDIGLTAVGLINTRLPNGEKGFSMLVNISVLFTPTIPLSFGFTLNAVGGLVGIHRTMKVGILRERVQNGAVNSIMFPENVIENSSKIISDLRAVFPSQKKHYVVAPFFKIGYGTPTILEADIGILLELPFKGRIILLGSLGVYLPNKEMDQRLGEIHVDVYGDFNFAASYVLIEGRLRDSYLVQVALTGGFAFMLDWGSQPQFLLSVGGYHPRYKKPAKFPDVPRVTALIKKGDDIRLTCEYYQAITSNSYQIGVSAELVINKGHARATGFVGFNGLLQFDPLYFEADIRISVDVSYRGRSFFGVGLEFLLSGPEPWRAKGYAKIKVLFFSLKIRFNHSWGGKQKVVPLIIQPDALVQKLKNQLQLSESWSVKAPAGTFGGVALRNLEDTEDPSQVLMPPAGYLELRQNMIPLNRTIQKMGNSYLANDTKFSIVNFTFGTGEPVETNHSRLVQDYFSRGQYEELADSEKLSTPDFDLMTAGIEIVPAEVFDIPDREEDIQSTTNDFEDIIITPSGTTRSKGAVNWQGEGLMNLLGNRNLTDLVRPGDRFGVVEEIPVQPVKSYKILSKNTLQSPGRLTARYFNSYSGAKEFLQTHWAKEQQRNWQIMQVEAEESEEMVHI